MAGMLTAPSYRDVLRQASSKPVRADRGGGPKPEDRGVERALIQ
jgi:hypothetical protein